MLLIPCSARLVLGCEGELAMRKTMMAVVAATAMMIGMTQGASAGVINLNTSNAILPAVNFGTVTYLNGVGGVDVTVNLSSGYNFVETGGQHTAFAFNLNVDITAAAITLLDSPGNFTLAAISPAQATPFGTFEGGIDCTSCKNGSPGFPSPLTFHINGVTEMNFVNNSNGYVFAADLMRLSDGTTGSVAGAIGSTRVPEPASMAILGAGMIGLGMRARRRRA